MTIPKTVLRTVRVTIVLPESLDKKLRTKQAKIIESTLKGYSYSKVVADTLRKGLA